MEMKRKLEFLPYSGFILGMGERSKGDLELVVEAAKGLVKKPLILRKKWKTKKRKTLLRIVDTNKSYMFKYVRFEEDEALSLILLKS